MDFNEGSLMSKEEFKKIGYVVFYTKQPNHGLSKAPDKKHTSSLYENDRFYRIGEGSCGAILQKVDYGRVKKGSKIRYGAVVYIVGDLYDKG